MTQVGILDYGMGNLRSVANALRVAGGEPLLVARPQEVEACERLIVPGVGAFAQAMAHLHQSGVLDALQRSRLAGTPILGICLGMQLMCRTSEEDGMHAGLGWIDARVRMFPAAPGYKVPHIGWDDVTRHGEHALLDGMLDASDFYFVHSLFVDCDDAGDVLLSGAYGVPYCALFARGNVAGAQFHPEKSQQAGIRLLKNFLAWQPC